MSEKIALQVNGRCLASYWIMTVVPGLVPICIAVLAVYVGGKG